MTSWKTARIWLSSHSISSASSKASCAIWRSSSRFSRSTLIFSVQATMLPSGRFQMVSMGSGGDGAQGIDQRLAFAVGADGDAQELLDPRVLEMADDDALIAQRLGQFPRVVQGVAGEDEVGGRGPDQGAEAGEIGRQP